MRTERLQQFVQTMSLNFHYGLTVDPVPVDLHHDEFYIFGGVDGTPAEIDSTAPTVEFYWGAMPRVQLHTILFWGGALLINISVAIATTKVPMFLKQGFWAAMHEGRTDLCMFAGLIAMMLLGAGSLSLDERWQRA